MNWVLCCCVGAAVFATAGVACADDSPPISEIRVIRALSPQQREAGLRVNLDVVVMYYHPEWGVLFVHDGKDGICVGLSPDRRPTIPYLRGQRLHIDGIAGPGEFLPVVLPDRVLVEGSMPMPKFETVGAEALFEPGLDCHPVEVQAVVKNAWFGDDSLVVELQVDGWRVKAVVPRHPAAAQLPWELVEHRVTVHGVAGTHFNDQRQMSGRLLFVQDLESFVQDADTEPLAEAPLVPVDGLLRVDSPLRQRVRVQGVATYVVDGQGVYLRGQGGSMFVQSAQPIAIARGDRVEAEGYPAVTAFRPSLSAINIKVIGKAEPPAPLPFVAAQTRHSREQCELITLKAQFLELTQRLEGSSLLCAADGEVFEAVLAGEIRPPELEQGMQLQLTGICEFASTRPLVIPRNATGFRVQLRDQADIVVLARPPWWSTRRAWWVLGIIGGGALLVGGWAVMLQILVRRQSSVIRQQAQQQATMEERQRIARDLHDTLEQELVGVAMLLDNASKKMNGGEPQAGQTLNLARRLLRRVRIESRSTIREMRSVTLEKRGLAAALEETLRPLAATGGAAFSVAVQGLPVRLPGTVETHLLRLAQEAVANASHHAAAAHIVTRLVFEEKRVCLEVTDDGCGFDPESAQATAGHFGLSGMRERADKIGAHLRITSELGRGSQIHVSVPIGSFSPSSSAIS